MSALESDSQRSTLYWIGTPRHFLIAAGMAVGEYCVSDAHILLTSSQDYVGGIFKALDRWSDSPFSATCAIGSKRRFNNPLAEKVRLAKSVIRYRRMAARTRYTEIRAFSGTEIGTQAYLYEVRRRSPLTKRVVIEDGGIFYNDQFITGGDASDGYPKWKMIAGRLLYGPAWAAVKKNGLREVIDEIHLIAPELVRKQLASLNMAKLSPDCLWRLSDTDLPSIYFSLFDCDERELASIDVAIILSRSDGLIGDPGGYLDAVDALLNVATRLGFKVAVKYHPKEQLKDYMGLRDKVGIVEVPRELPMELLFLVNTSTLKYVLGDTSSALIGAPWILPDSVAVSFVNMVNKLPELIYPDFERFGVRLIDTEHDFEKLLLSA